mmetsp:Transcript_10442/g.11970  ORF Transcript_10442/g.11970 Transcript_10442/m.11970 type:complete len:322 (-) Transcript_10442:955-1920(-)
MLEDNIDLERQHSNVGCNEGYFYGNTRRTALILLLWAILAAMSIFGAELWRMVDPTFLRFWKEQREEENYQYQEYQFYVNAVIGILVGISLPLCVYFGASKMSKPLLHLFSGYTMVCCFFTFVGAFQYFVLCNVYSPQYCYTLGGVELIIFITFVMSCTYSLNLLREIVAHDSMDEVQGEPQPQQETFGNFYNSWMSSTPQETTSTYASSSTNTVNYPTATATVVGTAPNGQVEMATVAATPVAQTIPMGSQGNASVTPVSDTFNSGYTAAQSTGTTPYYPQGQSSSYASPSNTVSQPGQEVSNNSDQQTSTPSPNFVTKA